VANIDGLNVLLLVSLLTPVQSRRHSPRVLFILPLGAVLSVRHLVCLSGRTRHERRGGESR